VGELTVAGVCEAIWDTERELSLLDWQVDGVSVWPLVRMRVFHDLTRRSGLLGDPHPVRRTAADRARLVGRHAVALLRRNPFLTRGSYRAVVVPHHRKLGGDDVYSAQIRAELGRSALVLDTNRHSTALPRSFTLDFFVSFAGVTGRLRHKLRPGSGLAAADADRARQAADALEKRTGFRPPLTGLVSRELNKHIALRSLHRRLLRRLGAETLYVVVGYFQQHVIGAARDLGIAVIELQHGTITPYHLGYSYPGRPAVGQQPDELWCFGRYWAETVDLPAGTSARVVGWPQVYRAEGVTKDPRLVLFCSQGTIGPRLLAMAGELAGSRPDLRVVFRLHPSEHRSDYGTVPDAVELSEGDVSQTYELMAAATYQAGVSSTTLFEGMAMGCRTVVVGLPGWEYMAPAVDRGDAVLAHDSAELAHLVDDAPLCRDSSGYYAPPLPRLTR
jgi:hypothetical protein